MDGTALMHLRTSMIYTHVMNRGGRGVNSPVTAYVNQSGRRISRRPDSFWRKLNVDKSR
jgi:hypothetical protein